MDFLISCPRCRQLFTSDTEKNLATILIEHAAQVHDHHVPRERALARIERNNRTPADQ